MSLLNMLVFKAQSSQEHFHAQPEMKISVRKGIMMWCSYEPTAVYSPVDVHSAIPAHAHAGVFTVIGALLHLEWPQQVKPKGHLGW